MVVHSTVYSSRQRRVSLDICLCALAEAPGDMIWLAPIYEIRLLCCARTASGHVAATPPSAAIRRRYHASIARGIVHGCFGSLGDISRP
jgi:hypothetical protein